jgi:hypothetical protein
MPLKLAVRAAEPTPLRLWCPSTAGWAGGRGATFVHSPNDDPHPGGFVAERLHQVGTPPLTQPEVLHPAKLVGSDALGITDHQRTDPLPEREGDHLSSGLVVGLVNSAPVTGFYAPLLGPVPAPTSRAVLAWLGRAPSHPRPSCLLIPQMEIALGADRASRDQQPSMPADDRIRVNDAEIHARHPGWVRFVILNRKSRGDGEPEATRIVQQRDRPQRLERIRDRAGQPHP